MRHYTSKPVILCSCDLLKKADMVYLTLLLLAFWGGNTMAFPSKVDLSHTYYLDPPASHKINVLEKSMNRIQIEVDLYQMCSSEYAGTHLEAPITFNQSGFSVDKIPFDRLLRVPGVLMKISPYVNHEYNITAETFWEWERRTHLFIPDGGVLLIETGFSQQDYSSNDRDEENTVKSPPRLSTDAAEWIVNYSRRHDYRKGIIGVGTDLDSLDNHDSNATTSARAILYSANIYALHNLKNLIMVPRSDFLVTVMPMKINKGTGAPARVLTEEDPQYRKPDWDDRSDGGRDWRTESDHWNSGRDHFYPSNGILMASAESSYSVSLVSLLCPLTIQCFWMKFIA